jgi:hypothetical protein
MALLHSSVRDLLSVSAVREPVSKIPKSHCSFRYRACIIFSIMSCPFYD